MAAKGKAPRITARRNVAELEAELERRTAERDEALAQQAAAAEVLQIVASSPERLEPVFEAILRNAVRICGGTFGVLAIREGDGFRGAAAHGVGPEFTDTLTRFYHPVPGTTLDTVQETKRTIQIADCAAEPAYEPVRARNPAHAMVRTHLCVPMLRDSGLLGAILVYRDEVLPFTDRQVALIEDFAKQAVIAMENVRLIAETREALEQQTATAEVLQVINSSPADLDPVFGAILEKAFQVCGGVQGSLLTFEGGRPRLAAARNLSPDFVEIIRKEWERRGPLENHPMARLARGERVVQILDMAVADFYKDGDPTAIAAVEIGNVHTVIFVALIKDSAPLGAFVIARREVRAFTDKQIALLQNFAAQAVIAMENARLMNETREALEQQTATAEVLGVINSSPGDLAPVFDAILEKAHALCGAEIGSLTIYDGEENRAVATRGLVPGFADRLRQGFRPGPAHPIRKLLSGARIVQVPDVGESVDQIAREGFEQGGIRTSLYVPLRKDDRLLGLIVASRQEVRLFSDKEITLLENFAAQAVIAMENARLLGELRQRTDEVAELNRGLEARVAEQVDELARVGRLKRFLAPQLAELIVSHRDEKILESHRREIVVVFCDLRGYTAFTETAEPEEVLDFLREYHGALGPLVSQFEGTLDQFSGDGIMVFFNDPVPIPDPAERAVRMAIAMREAAGALIADWRRRDRELGFGAGIAQGYATLGQIGFAERSGYTAIGTVCNLAARLCAEAKNGQILIAGRVAAAVEKIIALEDLGSLALKGLTQPVSAFNVPLAATPPALRVIEGGPQSL